MIHTEQVPDRTYMCYPAYHIHKHMPTIPWPWAMDSIVNIKAPHQCTVSHCTIFRVGQKSESFQQRSFYNFCYPKQKPRAIVPPPHLRYPLVLISRPLFSRQVSSGHTSWVLTTVSLSACLSITITHARKNATPIPQHYDITLPYSNLLPRRKKEKKKTCHSNGEFHEAFVDSGFAGVIILFHVRFSEGEE